MPTATFCDQPGFAPALLGRQAERREGYSTRTEVLSSMNPNSLSRAGMAASLSAGTNRVTLMNETVTHGHR